MSADFRSKALDSSVSLREKGLTMNGTVEQAISIPCALTPSGFAALQLRLSDIREQRIPDLVPLLGERERDERHVAEFERLTAEAAQLEALLAQATVLTEDVAGFDGRAGLGMRVLVGLEDGTQTWIRPVHPDEAFLDDERISATSPLGKSVLGARAGHTVWIAAPKGLWACQILEIDPRMQ